LVKRRQITAFGWEVKRRLAERQLNQKEFCKKYQIPEARLSELITGNRPVKKYRDLVKQVLNIPNGYEEQLERRLTTYRYNK